MTVRVLLGTALSVGLTFFGVASAQRTSFKSGVMAVRIDVLVSDDGRPVTGLTSTNFEIRDNGVVQDARCIEDRDGVDVGLVLDTSGSVAGDRLRELTDAATILLQGLHPGDRVTVLSFNQDVRLLCPMTDDAAMARRAIGSLNGSGTTALHDALCAAAFAVRQDARRSLMLVFSDGLDNSSWLTAPQLYDSLARSELVLYAVRPDSPEVSQRMVREHQVALERLVEQTGGSVLNATSSALRPAFRRVLDEFRSRYLLAFTPSGVRTGDGWHKLEVRLKSARGKLTARPRPLENGLMARVGAPTVRVWLVLLSGLLLTCGQAHAASRQGALSPQHYDAVLRQYRAGDSAAAVSESSGWDVAALQTLLRTIEEAEARRIAPRLDADEESRLVGIAALHAEAAVASGARERFDMHANLGERAVRALCARRLRGAFCRTWFQTMAGFALVLGDMTRAESLLVEARRQVGDAPETLVALGVLQEVSAGPFGIDPDFGGLSQRQRIEARERREPTALLGNARGLYEKALRQDRTFAEAHLRLGRVLMQLGHREEAQQELRACLQSAQNAILSYLAQLLLGSTFEVRGDYPLAEQWYKAASETVQDDLSARLGLARVLDATGRSDLAARSISEFLERRPRDGRSSGLWWRYELGQLADTRCGALRELRASARAREAAAP